MKVTHRILALTLTALAACPAAASARPFARSSFWNKPLGAHATLDPRSASYVADMESQLAVGNPWINTTYYSTPVYTVGARQRTVRVVLDTAYKPLQNAWRKVPLPRDARPATGTDEHAVVYQPARDRMWEFWHLHRVHGRWHARWGGEMDHVSRNPGYYTGAHRTWGATATSLPLLGGLIRIGELRRGRIDHALAIAVPRPRAGSFRWPARRTDGWIHDTGAITEGMRFRLDPTVDIAALHLPPIVRMLAEAAQRYGLVVRDKSANVAFYAEDPTPLGWNPYAGPTGFFGGQYPNRLLEQFPWSRLQALR